MDWHPVQGISSGHFGLWLVCAFAIYLVLRVLELFNGLSKGALCSEPVIFKVLCIIIFVGKLRFPSHPRQEQNASHQQKQARGLLSIELQL